MTFTEILSSDFLMSVVIRALIVGALISVCSSLLGVSLVMKRYSMIGDGLSHVGYFALALGALVGVGSEISQALAIPVVIAAAVLILKLDESRKISGDAACAIVATGSVAVGTIVFSISGTATSDICSSLFGSSSVVTVTNRDAVLSIVLAAVVIVWFLLFFKQIFSTAFDEQFAAASGIKTSAFRMLLAVLTAVTIVVGMKMMGAIMISALIVFPAMSAMRLAKSFKGVVIFAALASVLCFVIGFAAACRFSLQTGAAVVCVELALFIVSCVFEKLRAAVRTKRSFEKTA